MPYKRLYAIKPLMASIPKYITAVESLSLFVTTAVTREYQLYVVQENALIYAGTNKKFLNTNSTMVTQKKQQEEKVNVKE